MTVNSKLPSLPKSWLADTKDGYYTRLGVVFLLDVHSEENARQLAIGDYYPFVQNHVRHKTCFIAVCEKTRPIGYLFWKQAETGVKEAVLVCKSAPFGGYKYLQSQWESHILYLIHGIR